MFESTRICNNNVLISYILVSISTVLFSYVSTTANVGDINVLILLDIWAITSSLISTCHYILLSHNLKRIDKEYGGYLNNKWIDKIYLSSGLLYLNGISNCILTLIDIMYYSYTYVPDTLLILLSAFKYMWHILSIILTLLLIHNIKNEIKYIPTKVVLI